MRGAAFSCFSGQFAVCQRDGPPLEITSVRTLSGGFDMFESKKTFQLVALMLAATSLTSMAQEGTPQEERRSLEEIVVTATMRESTTKDIPVSISVLSDADLQKIGARGFSDYLLSAPGVHYTESGRGRSQIVMRGVSTDATATTNLQSATEILVDEFATTNRWSAWTRLDPHMFDIERVEILRGPQGTLFGSGSMGGILRIITNKPDPSITEGRIDLGTSVVDGGGWSTDYNAMFNTPIIEDRLAIRGVAYHRKDAGWIDRVSDRIFAPHIEEPGQKNVNHGNSTGGRLMIAFEPSDKLATRLSFTYQEDFLAEEPASFLNADDGGEYEFTTPYHQDQYGETYLYNLYVNYQLESFDFMSSTTYGDRDSWLTQQNQANFDRYPGAPIYPQCDPVVLGCSGINSDSTISGINHQTESLAQELRLTSTHGGKWQWVAGAFFFAQDGYTPQIWYNPEAAIPGGGVTPPDRHTAAAEQGYLLDALYIAESRETAIFGEATYFISDKFSVAAGIRFYESTFDFITPKFDGLASRAFGTPLVPPTTQKGSGSLPRLSMTYSLTEDINVYAQAAEGFRLGQVNFGGGAVDPVDGRVLPLGFDSDSLWSYELGVKMSLFDQSMRLDVAVFNIDWTDIQLTRYTATNLNFTDNAGDATSRGIELELLARPTNNVEYGFSATYTDATLDSVLPGVVLTEGVTLPGTPDLSLSSHVELSMDTQLESYIRFDARHVGEMERSLANDPLLRSDAYTVANLRAGIFFGTGNEVVLYMNNIFNASDAVTKQSANPSIAARAYRLKPREIGVSYRVHFGGR